MNLFDQAREDRIEQNAPLAARMRPRTLDEFIGQEAIVGPGRLLRRSIQADRLSSLIFYGPPGTGKTTLAQVIANSTSAHFTALNAVLAGVKDIREAVAGAQERLGLHGRRTVLFVDEVHRFNKSQQDALLPWVENGTVIFIGATTENPYFEVNKALVSRSRIFQLKSLGEADLRRVVHAALTDERRGYGHLQVEIAEDAIHHLINVANGDARALLNALELAVETTEAGDDGTVRITLSIAEESIQRRAVLYDKEGDAHFDTISAFIKSMRGSDPDATLYWLAKMVYAGEDPHFIFRRMLIFASEDVGMADPQAVPVIAGCAAAFDRVGMPEGQFPLAQAAIYLATAAKSNTSFAFFDALDAVRNEPEQDVPNHLRDGNRDKEGFGHGEGYLYPHAYREHWVAQQYLPKGLQGKLFYQPTRQGYEAGIHAQVQRRREAQLAAMVEGSGAPPEILTFSPDDPARERWLQRTISQAGQAVGALRDRLLAQGPMPRHAIVLDVNVGSGLLTWESLRQVPEGGVYSLAFLPADADAVTQQAQNLAPLDRPVVLSGKAVDDSFGGLRDALPDPSLRFDVILGRNGLMAQPDKEAALAHLLGLLQPDGWLAVAERVPRHTQRIYDLVDLSTLAPDLAERYRQAEEAIYQNSADPLVNWDEHGLKEMARAAVKKVAVEKTVEKIAGEAGSSDEHPMDAHTVTVEMEQSSAPMRVTEAVLKRWFQTGQEEGRRSYRQWLGEELSKAEVEEIEGVLRRQLLNQTVMWQATTLFLTIKP